MTACNYKELRKLLSYSLMLQITTNQLRSQNIYENNASIITVHYGTLSNTYQQ